MDDDSCDVIVIGGGASGMMAAAIAAKSGAKTLLIEKNPSLGNKLSISGGGRCNILNAEADERLLLANYGKADKFLFSAFSQFGMQETYNYFESIGLPLKIEARKRAFPASENAVDVVNVLKKELTKNGVKILLGTKVNTIYAPNGEIAYIQIGKKRFRAESYILATGGASRPETGSTGDGFKWLASTGHSVNQPTPNITPLAVKERWVSKISGVTAKNAEIKFYLNDKFNFKVKGDILFTHFGLSAPTILNSSKKVGELLTQGTVTARIDCHPSIDQKQLDQKLLEILNQHSVKQFKNVIKLIAPNGLSKAFESLLSKEELETKNSELTKEQRLKVVKLIKAIPLTIDKLMGFEKAVVADGGVDLKDIDTRTMRSKKVSNLYITGDLLDINRPSGGYSLQLCWTTGYIAGIHANSL